MFIGVMRGQVGRIMLLAFLVRAWGRRLRSQVAAAVNDQPVTRQQITIQTVFNGLALSVVWNYMPLSASINGNSGFATTVVLARHVNVSISVDVESGEAFEWV
jgi:hypothetical protein